MLRVGVMIDSLTTSAWVAKIIEDIKESDFSDISLVIINDSEVNQPSLQKSMVGRWDLKLFHHYERWDYEKYKTSPDAMAPRDLSIILSGIESITVNLDRSCSPDSFDNNLLQIRAANLDVIFLFGFRTLRNESLNLANYGVWSFRLGDKRDDNGNVPLFWELYEKNYVSGSLLQVVNGLPDGGCVIYRSHSATDFTSLYRSRNPVYWKTAEFALRRLRDLDSRGWGYIESLATCAELPVHAGSKSGIPSNMQMMLLFWRLARASLLVKMSSRVTSRFEQWFLAIRKRSIDHSFGDALEYHIVRPPLDRFYADPFLFKRDGKTYLFFEDYRYKESQAIISCAELNFEGSLIGPVEVLRRPYHLSYPFVIEHEGSIYMIPETRQNGTVELYRADNFPVSWSLVSILLKEVGVVDATIHQANGKFWMFAGLANGAYSSCDELGLFYAESLFGGGGPLDATS